MFIAFVLILLPPLLPYCTDMYGGQSKLVCASSCCSSLAMDIIWCSVVMHQMLASINPVVINEFKC
jgi:hypothetical protein